VKLTCKSDESEYKHFGNEVKLSVVTTLYKSSPHVEEFVRQIFESAVSITNDLELIIVDDGSPDDSLDKAIKLKNEYGAIKIIQLSRNFGHHEAILTGLEHTNGDLVFLMDSDLEESPEDVTKFFHKMKEDTDADVIYGVQRQRNKGLADRLMGYMYYRLFNLLSDIQIPRNLTTTRLMSRAYVDALLAHGEADVLLSGLWARTGFTQVPLEVEKKYKGSSSYNLNKQLRLLVRSVTSFSAKPLVYIFYLGLSISLVAFMASLWFIYRKLFHHVGVGGWTSLFVSVWFIGGLLTLSIGVVGIYIERIFRQVKLRPRTIIKKIH
jgi:putative glycosyltransferase